MSTWRDKFNFDPVPPLLSTENKALLYFIKRDLLEEEIGSVEDLWELPLAVKIIKKQKEDGSWIYPGKGKDPESTPEDYNQLETFRNLGFLVEKFGFNKKNALIEKAADFLFSKQTEEGDFRGIYGTQYAHSYSSAILELLIKAGYVNDPRIEKSFEWLLSTRQDDGGWAFPLRTHKAKYLDIVSSPIVLQPIKSKPFSHLLTGMVLRPFVAHEKYKKHEAAKIAGKLLISRFFQNDKYSDRRDKSYWLKFSFPFWWTDLLSALDSLSALKFSSKDAQIKKALDWFISEQQENGFWTLKILKGKNKDLHLWIGLTICRIFKRF